MEEEKKKGIGLGLEALGHYDEMGRLRIKFESLMNFIGDLLKGFGFDIDVTDKEANGRAMDEAREQANQKKEIMVQLREQMEAAERRAADADAAKAKLEADLAALKAEHEAMVAALKSEHETAIAALKAEHESVIAALKGDQGATVAELQNQLSAAQKTIADLNAAIEALKAENQAKLAARESELAADKAAALAAANAESTAALAAKDGIISEKDGINAKLSDRIGELEREVDKFKGLSMDEVERLQDQNEELRKRVGDFEKAYSADDPKRQLADALKTIRGLGDRISELDWALDQFNISDAPDAGGIAVTVDKLKSAGIAQEKLDRVLNVAKSRQELMASLEADMVAGNGSYATVTDLIEQINRLNGLREALDALS